MHNTNVNSRNLRIDWKFVNKPILSTDLCQSLLGSRNGLMGFIHIHIAKSILSDTIPGYNQTMEV